jgi:GntR family transcriptional repressor for pyruvate dehydrogenase complex
VGKPTNPLSIDRLERRPSLVSELAARISGEIESGRMAPGSRLPPEHELTTTLGVSRATLREALAALRREGLIVARQGSGTFVADGPVRRAFRINGAELRTVEDVLSVIELRLGVEVEAASLAAERRTKLHLDRMAALLDAMDAAISRGESAADADFEFHRVIADATGNGHFRRFLDFLGPLVIPRQSVSQGLLRPGTDPRVYLRRIQAEHRAIQAAIEAGDPAAARKAARLHLIRGRERYGVPRQAQRAIEDEPAVTAGIQNRGGRK